MWGDVVEAAQRGVCEDVDVLWCVVFGRERLLEQEEGGLHVENALAQVGEFVVERTAAVVEGLVGEGLPLFIPC